MIKSLAEQTVRPEYPKSERLKSELNFVWFSKPNFWISDIYRIILSGFCLGFNLPRNNLVLYSKIKKHFKTSIISAIQICMKKGNIRNNSTKYVLKHFICSFSGKEIKLFLLSPGSSFTSLQKSRIKFTIVFYQSLMSAISLR